MFPQIKSLVWIVGGKQSRFHQILGVIQSLSGVDGCDWSLSNMVTLVWSKLAFSHHSTHSRCHCGGGKGLNFDLRSLWRKLIGDLDWLVIENQEMFRTRLFSCHPERLNPRLQSLQFVISEVPRLHRRRGVACEAEKFSPEKYCTRGLFGCCWVFLVSLPYYPNVLIISSTKLWCAI